MIVESILQEKLENNIVQCNVCNHRCNIANGKYGFCFTRKNNNGKLYSCNYGVVSSFAVDPIEKKPLYHFLPGSLSYSLGGFGCNMRCLNCQNYSISQNYNISKNYNTSKKIGGSDRAFEILPKTAVKNAIDRGCQSISWTYNEPTMYLEYTLETAKISHENDLKNIYVSNGYMSEEALKLLIPKIDAFNIDLKSMSNQFYKDICKATLDPILDNLKLIYKNKKHLEITNLLINGFNGSDELMNALIEFIANELGENVPIHFSRFFPYYKMNDVSPTNIAKLQRAKEIAKKRGLQYVYLGNISDNQNSYCPKCGELLIERNGYNIIDKNKIKNNKCIICGEKLNFKF